MADGGKGVAPLSFAIDTAALEQGYKAAEAFAGKAKELGAATGDANKNLGDMGKTAGDSAKGVEDATKAAEKLAEANKKVADSAKDAKQAQVELANAPKPAPVVLPQPGAPSQSAAGGWYADQNTADWANDLSAKRAQKEAEQNARVKAAKDRFAEANKPLEDVQDAAEKADGAVGALSTRMSATAVAAGAMGAALGVGVVTALFQASRATISMADDSLLLERRLSAITGTATAATAAIDGMKASAQSSGSTRSGQVALQSELLGEGGLNLQQDEIARFGTTLGQIDAISGNKADAFDRFGNTVSSSLKDGRIALGELNNMLDQSPALAGRLAEAFEMPIDQIKQMALEGGLFSEDFVRRLNAVDGATKATFDALGETSERGFSRAKEAASSFWESLVNSEAVTKVTTSIADAITEGFGRAERELKGGDFWPRLLVRLGMIGTGTGALMPAFDNMVDAADGAREKIADAGRPSGLPWQGDFNPVNNFGQNRGTHSHGGVDIPMGVGTPIYARADGTIRKGVASDGNAAGNRVHLTYGDGSRDSFFHLQRFNMNLRSDSVKAGDIIGFSGNTGRSSGPHLHWERFDAEGNRINPLAAQESAAGEERSSRATALMNEGGSVRVRQIQNDLAILMQEKARNPNDPSVDARIAEKQAELRQAQAAQSALSRTPVSNAQAAMADRQRAASFGGGGSAIASQAYASARAAREAGYEVSDDDFMQIGISGAVLGADSQVQRLSRQASAAESGAAAAGRSRIDVERERIDRQVEDFRYQNFGSLTGEGVDKAVDSYREALERLTKAQRDTANAQELLNAKTQDGIGAAEAQALASGARGYAVDLARQEAEEAAIARDGGSVDAARLRFDSRNRAGSARRAAGAADMEAADARYMGIGSDAYSRREYGRGEQLERAGQEFDGAARQAEMRARFAREDAMMAKDRADADAEAISAAERQLEVAGKVGEARRAAQAILERENDLIRQGLLESGQKLGEEEAKSVAANAERLRLIQQQVEEMDRFANLSTDTSSAVGGGLRSLASDFFADARVESEKLISVVQGVVSRIGTSIADGLIIKPIERATEKVADIAVEWIGDSINSMRGGRAGGGQADVGRETAKTAAEMVKATAATTAKAAAETKATVATTGASAALAGLTKAATAAAGALAAAAKSAGASALASAAGGGAPAPAAFGRVFPFAFGGGIGSGMGGVGDSPVLFPMAGGMGLAFEAGPEAVLPLKRGSDGRLGVAAGGGGGGTVIQVFDQRGTDAPPVETQETEGPDGKRMISMFIRSEQKAAFREGAMDKTMQDTYGMNRPIARR